MEAKDNKKTTQEENKPQESLKIQLLFLFYKFNRVSREHFKVVLQSIFNNFDNRFDVKIAFSALGNNSVIQTPFLGKSWKRHFRTTENEYTNLAEYRKEILNMQWSDNPKRIKIVCYMVPKNVDVDVDVENEVKETISKEDPVNSFIAFKKIIQIGTIKIEDEDLHLENSFETFLTDDTVSDIINKAAEIDFEELALAKRLTRSMYDDYKKDKLKPFEKPSDEVSLSTDLCYSKKKDYLDQISIDDLHFGFTDKIEIKNKTHDIFKDFQIQEGTIHFDGMKRIYWIERCISEETLLIQLDINSTADYLAQEFNLALPTDADFEIKVSRLYFLKLSSASKNGFLIANSTDIDLKKAVVQNALPKTELSEAFMHFSYHFTNKHLIVFDMRPFETGENRILFTEPIVFSNDKKRYGASNHGEKGIKSLMDKHKCNRICKNLNLNSEL